MAALARDGFVQIRNLSGLEREGSCASRGSGALVVVGMNEPQPRSSAAARGLSQRPWIPIALFAIVVVAFLVVGYIERARLGPVTERAAVQGRTAA